MKKSTYIICLAGQFHALATDLFMETITDPETGASRSGIRTVADRNAAILAITRPHSWREALALAKAAGNYIGQLYPEEHHIHEAV